MRKQIMKIEFLEALVPYEHERLEEAVANVLAELQVQCRIANDVTGNIVVVDAERMEEVKNEGKKLGVG